MKNSIKDFKVNKRLTVLTLSLLIIVGVSLAYIIPQLMDGAFGNANIISDSVDRLNFEVTKDIELSVNQFTLAPGESSQSDTAVAKATLLANSTRDTATYNYYVYFSIFSNEFVYSQNENTPEIILTITDPNGNEMDTLNGLTYVTATDGTKGFDITTKQGLIKVTDNYVITASSTTETIQEWTFTVSFINLNADQSINVEKEFSGKVMIQQKEPVLLANYIKSTYVNNEIGQKLLYHDDTLENGAEDFSYRYSGGDLKQSGTCTYEGNVVNNVYIKEYYVTLEENNSTYNECQKIYRIPAGDSVVYIDASFENITFNEPMSVEWDSVDGKCKITNTSFEVIDWHRNSVSQENCNGLAYQYEENHDLYFIGELLEKPGDYVEISPESTIDNYVCFGSDVTPCPYNNLYRIIGLFDDDNDGNYSVKLIKSDYVSKEELGTDGDYYGENLSYEYYKGNNAGNIALYSWNYNNDTTMNDGFNIWSTSLLNKINLNTNYITNLGKEWTNKIENTTWQVGGNMDLSISFVTASEAYYNEIVFPDPGIYGNGEMVYKAKIGLMYMSDYAFSVSRDCWTTPLYSQTGTDYGYDEIKTNNWVYMGLNELTISRAADWYSYIFAIYLTGRVGDHVSARSGAGVRPAFYLGPSVEYKSGTGTYSDPFRIVV